MKDDCNNCQNQHICKWCDEFQRVNSEVNRVEFDKILSPISATIKCSSFQKKLKREDGISFHR